MKAKSILSHLAIASIMSLFSLELTAGPNPVSADWVVKEIAKATAPLTASDWAAACTTGSPTSTSGCLGNIASPQFAKLNQRLGWPTDFANTPIVSVDNSIFILQYGGNSAVPFPSNARTANIDLSAVTGIGGARCALYTLHGNPSGWQGTMAGQDGTGANPQPNSGGMVAISVGQIEPASTSCGTSVSGICFANQTNPSATIAIPQYLLCIGSTFQGSTEQPTSLVGIKAS